jgi:hypothetical protein
MRIGASAFDLNILLSSLLTTWGTSSLFVQVTVLPAGMVMAAGPKLKLSIFTSVPLLVVSPGLAAGLGLVPAVKANAIAKIAADPNIHLMLFIFFLL